jgi:hypothetical protein
MTLSNVTGLAMHMTAARGSAAAVRGSERAPCTLNQPFNVQIHLAVFQQAQVIHVQHEHHAVVSRAVQHEAWRLRQKVLPNEPLLFLVC